MFRARIHTVVLAIALSLTLAATALAQTLPGMPSGNMLAGRPQDDVASTPAATRIASSMVTDAFSARQWIVEFAIAQRAGFVRPASAKPRRAVVKRTPTWAP